MNAADWARAESARQLAVIDSARGAAMMRYQEYGDSLLAGMFGTSAAWNGADSALTAAVAERTLPELPALPMLPSPPLTGGQVPAGDGLDPRWEEQDRLMAQVWQTVQHGGLLLMAVLLVGLGVYALVR